MPFPSASSSLEVFSSIQVSVTEMNYCIFESYTLLCMIRLVRWRHILCILYHSRELLIKSLGSLINDSILDVERASSIRAVEFKQTIILNSIRDKNYFLEFCTINSKLNFIF